MIGWWAGGVAEHVAWGTGQQQVVAAVRTYAWVPLVPGRCTYACMGGWCVGDLVVDGGVARDEAHGRVVRAVGQRDRHLAKGAWKEHSNRQRAIPQSLKVHFHDVRGATM